MAAMENDAPPPGSDASEFRQRAFASLAAAHASGEFYPLHEVIEAMKARARAARSQWEQVAGECNHCTKNL